MTCFTMLSLMMLFWQVNGQDETSWIQKQSILRSTAVHKLSDADINSLRAEALSSAGYEYGSDNVYRFKSNSTTYYAWLASSRTWIDIEFSWNLITQGTTALTIGSGLTTTAHPPFFDGFFRSPAHWIDYEYTSGSTTASLYSGSNFNRYCMGHGVFDCRFYDQTNGVRCFIGKWGNNVMYDVEVFLYMGTASPMPVGCDTTLCETIDGKVYAKLVAWYDSYTPTEQAIGTMPTSAPTTGAFGDPHCVNAKGEWFDIHAVGRIPMVILPRNIKVESSDFAVIATTTTPDGWDECAPTFISAVDVLANHSHDQIRVDAGPAESLQVKQINGSTEAYSINALSDKVMITFGSVVVSVILNKVPRVDQAPFMYLDMEVRGLQESTAGGLLGADPHDFAEVQPDGCSGTALKHRTVGRYSKARAIP